MTDRLKPLDDIDTRFRGLALPMRRNPGGFFRTSYTRDVIRASIHTILNTRPGERVMLPEFGSNLKALVFEPNDAITRALLRRIVVDDIQRWEPRVAVTGVETRSDEHTVQIHVSYRILSLSVEDATVLVFRSREDGSTR